MTAITSRRWRPCSAGGLLRRLACAGLTAACACAPTSPGIPASPGPARQVEPPASAEPAAPTEAPVATADAGSPPEGEPPTAITATALAGPFAKLDDHCARTRALGGPYKCDLALGAFGRKLEGGKGSILGARLFMIPFDMAGQPASLCLMGVHTKLGWFVEDPEMGIPCQGSNAPGGTITTTTEELRWSDGHGAIIAQTRRRTTRGSKKSRSASFWQTRDVTVCGVGPSGVPSCASLPVGCSRPDHGPALPAPRWRFRLGEGADGGRGVVEIDQIAHGEEVQCESDAPGTRAVVFP